MKRALVFVGFALVGSAQALVIDTYPDWQGNITDGWQKAAQSFEVDSLSTTLQNLRFSMAPSSGASVKVQVFRFDANGPTGAALFERTVARPAGGGQIYISDVATQTFPAGTYGFVLDMLGQTTNTAYYNINQNSYNQGHSFFFDGTAWTSFPTYNLTFRAEFSSLPEPGTVVAICVGGLGSLARRRRKSV
jgi:hypothetical protein